MHSKRPLDRKLSNDASSVAKFAKYAEQPALDRVRSHDIVLATHAYYRHAGVLHGLIAGCRQFEGNATA